MCFSDLAYYPFPFNAIVDEWRQRGGHAYELIEPVDGYVRDDHDSRHTQARLRFHPGQIANALIADWLWRRLELDHPSFIGAVNPNNALIERLFGDQGGYGRGVFLANFFGKSYQKKGR